jgi:hypothetical protein
VVGINTRQQQIVLGCRHGIGQMTQDGQEEGVGHLHGQVGPERDDQPQGAVFAAAQIFSARMNGVLVRLCQGHDALARFGANGLTAIQGPRYGRRRDTCQFGDV